MYRQSHTCLTTAFAFAILHNNHLTTALRIASYLRIRSDHMYCIMSTSLVSIILLQLRFHISDQTSKSFKTNLDSLIYVRGIGGEMLSTIEIYGMGIKKTLNMETDNALLPPSALHFLHSCPSSAPAQ